MGSTMKPTIFDERVATALRSWHHAAKKHVKHNRGSTLQTLLSSRPTTLAHQMSPAHILTSPTRPEFEAKVNDASSSSNSIHHQEMEMGHLDHSRQQEVDDSSFVSAISDLTQHEIDVEHSSEFS